MNKIIIAITILFQVTTAFSQIAVPTYNSLGLYWSGIGGSEVTCTAEYRSVNDTLWFPAHNLWWDNRPTNEWHGQEYRGSIVGLKAGTTYEVKLTLSNGTESIINATTWIEVAALPIAKTIKIKSGESGFVIDEGGNENGYIVYDGTNATITEGNAVGVTINANYVILRNLIITNVGEHGIDIIPEKHHVIVDNCDVSIWGDSCKQWQQEMNNGINSNGGIHNITIQNCKIHHPRYDANSWREYECTGKTKHPMGARGIGFDCGETGKQYQIVIRNNQIYSDYEHVFNDGMGNNWNFSYAGFPGADSDIHNNQISHVWDDGLEIEGANCNVRVYENDIQSSNIAMAFATTSVGPLYAFRNTAKQMKAHQSVEFGWSLFKLGLDVSPENEKWYHGKIYLYHNMSYIPNGVDVGIAPSTPKKRQYYVTSRNNVLWCMGKSIADHTPLSLVECDLNYDLYNTSIPEGFEPNGIKGVPVLDGHCLAPNSPGYNQAIIIPNFNDKHSAWPMFGDGPDMGAFENRK